MFKDFNFAIFKKKGTLQARHHIFGYYTTLNKIRIYINLQKPHHKPNFNKRFVGTDFRLRNNKTNGTICKCHRRGLKNRNSVLNRVGEPARLVKTIFVPRATWSLNRQILSTSRYKRRILAHFNLPYF